MKKSKEPSLAEQERELAKMDLLPDREAQGLADDLLRSMLNSPPDPFTPPQKRVPKKRANQR
jgi:hypothetical protein